MDENTVKLSSGVIHYSSVGKGPIFLFLHGAIATPHAYTSLLTLIGSYFTVIAPTLPGHGDSFTISPDCTLEEYINTLKEFCDILNLKPDVLSGHSFGGALALCLASMSLGRRAIVFDPSGIPLPITPALYIRFIAKEMKASVIDQHDFAYLKSILPPAKTVLKSVFRHRREMPWFSAKAPAIDITSCLTEIKIPVFLLWGNEDKIVPVSIGREYSTRIPSSKLILLPKFGHAYPIIAPEKTFEKVMEVLSL